MACFCSLIPYSTGSDSGQAAGFGGPRCRPILSMLGSDSPELEIRAWTSALVPAGICSGPAR